MYNKHNRKTRRVCLCCARRRVQGVGVGIKDLLQTNESSRDDKETKT